MAQLPVLVCEENDAEKFVLKTLLARFDYRAIVVSSAEEAVAELKITKYAALFMDLGTAGTKGFDMVRRIRSGQTHPSLRVPIIALMERSAKTDFDSASAAGVEALLYKPFEAEELRRVLLRFVYNADRPNLKTLRALEVDNTDLYKEFKRDGTNN